ncbi:element excision factor XisH family protein [Roseofilum halophilum]
MYLAIKDTIHKNFFSRESIQEVTKLNQLCLIVVDMDKEEIVAWKD